MISHGITTIATNVGGNSEITNNRNGFLIESNNKDQLVKAMKTIVSNKNLLKRKSLQSKKDSKKFCLNEMIKNHTTIYENLTTN